MKITHTIVKPDGLCYGMVMPEKPYYGCKQFNKTECPCSIEHMCHCAIIKRDYDNALQSAKDAAVRYEDQETVKRMLVHGPHENEVFDAPYSYANPKPGVYPLHEPLECEKVWQCKIGSSWNNLSRRPLNWNTDKDPTYRTVLRISQGTDNKSLDPELSSIKARNKVFAGFGSEGGEPTRKVIAGCRYSKCDCASGDECFEYEKVGVEEKKEHESMKTEELAPSHPRLRILWPNQDPKLRTKESEKISHWIVMADTRYGPVMFGSEHRACFKDGRCVKGFFRHQEFSITTALKLKP